MTKEEVDILIYLYDAREQIMKEVYNANSLIAIYKHDNEDDSVRYQFGKKYAYEDAATIISKLINKIKNKNNEVTTNG